MCIIANYFLPVRRHSKDSSKKVKTDIPTPMPRRRKAPDKWWMVSGAVLWTSSRKGSCSLIKHFSILGSCLDFQCRINPVSHSCCKLRTIIPIEIIGQFRVKANEQKPLIDDLTIRRIFIQSHGIRLSCRRYRFRSSEMTSAPVTFHVNTDPGLDFFRNLKWINIFVNQLFWNMHCGLVQTKISIFVAQIVLWTMHRRFFHH